MDLNKLKSIYYKSPKSIKKAYSLIPFSIRNGREYRKWKMFLSLSVTMEDYVRRKISETIQYAKDNIKYYQMHNSGVDITTMPFVDKETVRSSFQDFQTKKIKLIKSFYVVTGGSTGEPMKYLQSKNVWAKEMAFIIDYFERYGYSVRNKKASFRGGDFNNLGKDKYWKENPIYNEIHFSPFHLNEKTVKKYVDKLNKDKILFFHAYPSVMITLMKFMKIKNLTLDYRPKAIFLISENYTMEQISKLKRFFRCSTPSFYGHSERLIFAPNIPGNEALYQVDERYGFFELIDSNGNIITKNNVQGEIVGTSFDNFAMPLIRYRTGDYTEYADYKQKIIKMIHGRWDQDFILGENNEEISIAALNMHSEVFKNVLLWQIRQLTPGQAELCIITSEGYTDFDSQAILNALNKKAGHAVKFSIKKVTELEKTERGKIIKVIKEI